MTMESRSGKVTPWRKPGLRGSIPACKSHVFHCFGRGGAGGVINRVTKEAGFTPLHELWLQGGAWGNRRLTAPRREGQEHQHGQQHRAERTNARLRLHGQSNALPRGGAL